MTDHTGHPEPAPAAVARVVATLARHHAGSMYFAPVSDTYLSIAVCADADGEKEVLDLDDDTWRETYDQLRGDHHCVIVTAAGTVRTW